MTTRGGNRDVIRYERQKRVRRVALASQRIAIPLALAALFLLTAGAYIMHVVAAQTVAVLSFFL